MQPLYFGSSERRLYGVYHPAASATERRSKGVVLCYPFGREYLRAHRAVRELAIELAGGGFHGLRFDYFGCGDSDGEAEEGTLEGWVGNVGAAVLEVEEISGSADLSAVGLRLGATLAALAAVAQGGRRLRRLALWDPIVVGARYLGELFELQRAWSKDHPRLSAAESREAPEILGFPLTPWLRREIEGIDLRFLPRPPAGEVLIVTGGEDEDAAALAEALEKQGAEVTRAIVPSGKFWLRQEGIDHAVVPRETVRRIASWLAGGGEDRR